MAPAPIVAAILVLAFAGACFFFALAETALFSLSQWQIRRLAERDQRRGGMVAHLLSEPQDLLAAMVLGNTFASAAMLAIAFWMALRGRWSAAPTVIGLFLLIVFVCEVLPKTLAVRRPEDWALRVAQPLLFLEKYGLFLRKAAQKLNSTILSALVPTSVTPHPDRKSTRLNSSH